jgi:hypothetical protein
VLKWLFAGRRKAFAAGVQRGLLYGRRALFVSARHGPFEQRIVNDRLAAIEFLDFGERSCCHRV